MLVAINQMKTLMTEVAKGFRATSFDSE